jgi:hypothetical protein
MGNILLYKLPVALPRVGLAGRGHQQHIRPATCQPGLTKNSPPVKQMVTSGNILLYKLGNIQLQYPNWEICSYYAQMANWETFSYNAQMANWETFRCNTQMGNIQL